MKFFNCCKRKESGLLDDLTPLELYTTAFEQYATRNRNLLRTIRNIQALHSWDHNIADIAMKDTIIATLKNHFKKYAAFLLAQNDDAPAENLFALFHAIIKSLPETWLMQEGIFAGLFETPLPNRDIPEQKFMDLVAWGMPLQNIAKDILRSKIRNLTIQNFIDLIIITQNRPDDSRYLRSLIHSDKSLIRILNHSARFLDPTTKLVFEKLSYQTDGKAIPLIRGGYPRLTVRPTLIITPPSCSKLANLDNNRADMESTVRHTLV